MKRFNPVLTYAGTPPASTFNSPDGTPIVIDTTASIPYYLNAGVVTALGGVGTVTHTAGALTSGLVVVGNGAADLKTLAAGTDGYVLTQAAGIASWAKAAGGITRGKVQALLQLPTTL